MNVLVVCGQNKRRSLTAERIYRNDNRFELRSAGVNPKARHTISVKDVEWADLILHMDKEQGMRIRELFVEMNLPVMENLEIEDDYLFVESDLVEVLRVKIELIVDEYLKN